MIVMGRVDDHSASAGRPHRESTSLLEQLRHLLSSSDCPADAVAVGGSKGYEGGDFRSDLDVFVFCADDKLGACLAYFSEWLTETRPDAKRHGPFLRDGFGVGYRFEHEAAFPLELFLMFESAWSAHPAAAKARFILSSGANGQKWVDRCRALEDTAAQLVYICDYIANTFFAYIEKIAKYIGRREVAGAAYYFLKASSIVISARLSLECAAGFDPDFALKKICQIGSSSIRQSADMLVSGALQRLGPPLPVLIEEAAHLMARLDALCGRDLEAKLQKWKTQFDARPPRGDS